MYHLLPDDIQKYILSFHSYLPFDKTEFNEKMKRHPKYMYRSHLGEFLSFYTSEEENCIDYDSLNYKTFRYALTDTLYKTIYYNVCRHTMNIISKWIRPYLKTRPNLILFIKQTILKTDYNAIRHKLGFTKTIDKMTIDELTELLKHYNLKYY